MANEKIWTYNYKGSFYNVPYKPGVYLIVFENGKRYVGSTNNIHKRLVNHLGSLLGKNHNSVKWYKLAREENNLPQYKPIETASKKGRKKLLRKLKRKKKR
jgi:GIY-YIG catalytic domain.